MNFFLYIQESLFSLDDVYGVADQGYLDATKLASEFNIAVNRLPALENITLDDADAVTALGLIYNNMTDYEKSFVSVADVSKLQSYVNRIEALKKDQEENGSTEE